MDKNGRTNTREHRPLRVHATQESQRPHLALGAMHARTRCLERQLPHNHAARHKQQLKPPQRVAVRGMNGFGKNNPSLLFFAQVKKGGPKVFRL